MSTKICQTDFLDSTQLEIRVENTSERPVDLCRLSFQDNLSTELADQLLDSETELTPGEAYELDWELRHTTILSWTQQPENFRIEAGEKSTLVIQCHGKYGWQVAHPIIDEVYTNKIKQHGRISNNRLRIHPPQQL